MCANGFLCHPRARLREVYFLGVSVTLHAATKRKGSPNSQHRWRGHYMDDHTLERARKSGKLRTYSLIYPGPTCPEGHRAYTSSVERLSSLDVVGTAVVRGTRLRDLR